MSNLFTPWPAIAFPAGRLQQAWRSAFAVGAVAEITCLIAFYTPSTPASSVKD
ncbi:hypothetical protein POF50_011135 [Streptomyces sp. SL13]|uniref:Uncharacterized protein n=1 Tax=Streptantibioticus silvisoli TaxID=2705255 RepID=A0AA90K8T9_9ACTN|nr:hypothetical protein [Streptantibioticus silvisoli]MDI5969882.1 hypothetical protein [Streptantibioticus silvisoli]